MKPWFDICTTAIPRNLTQTCFHSFFSWLVDRDNYNLRWIAHLDNYTGLEHLWCSNAQQFGKVATWFDDSVIRLSKKNVGYEASARWVMQRIENDAFWLEDDFCWTGRVDPLYIAERVHLNHCWGAGLYAAGTLGCLNPMYYRYPAIKYLAEKWPVGSGVDENLMKGILSSAGFLALKGEWLVRRGTVVDLGRPWWLDHGWDKTPQTVSIFREMTARQRERLKISLETYDGIFGKNLTKRHASEMEACEK